jgi:hypothetical protein
MAGAGTKPFPGPSLADLWTTSAAAQSWPAPVSELAEMGVPPFPSYYGPMTSVVTPQWHYVKGGKSGQELYPCCNDEPRDLASTPLGASLSIVFQQMLRGNGPITPELLRSELRERLQQRSLKGGVPALPSGQQNSANRQRMNDQLHALGYVR